MPPQPSQRRLLRSPSPAPSRSRRKVPSPLEVRADKAATMEETIRTARNAGTKGGSRTKNGNATVKANAAEKGEINSEMAAVDETGTTSATTVDGMITSATTIDGMMADGMVMARMMAVRASAVDVAAKVITRCVDACGVKAVAGTAIATTNAVEIADGNAATTTNSGKPGPSS